MFICQEIRVNIKDANFLVIRREELESSLSKLKKNILVDLEIAFYT